MKEWHSKSFFPAAILGLNFLFMCPFVKEEVSYGLKGQWRWGRVFQVLWSPPLTYQRHTLLTIDEDVWEFLLGCTWDYLLADPEYIKSYPKLFFKLTSPVFPGSTAVGPSRASQQLKKDRCMGVIITISLHFYVFSKFHNKQHFFLK